MIQQSSDNRHEHICASLEVCAEPVIPEFKGRDEAREAENPHELAPCIEWLECPVEETDKRGRPTRTTEARNNRRGIPQGSPLSPLLANLYIRRAALAREPCGNPAFGRKAPSPLLNSDRGGAIPIPTQDPLAAREAAQGRQPPR